MERAGDVFADAGAGGFALADAVENGLLDRGEMPGGVVGAVATVEIADCLPSTIQEHLDIPIPLGCTTVVAVGEFGG